MNIYIYSDESGVFDKLHNDFFVFGGIVFTDKEQRDICSRQYISAENCIQKSEEISGEVKATTITNKSKNKLFRSVNHIEKFGVVIDQKKIYDRIFENKKSKQRYMDYAYKMAIKNKFKMMISKHMINTFEVEHLYFYNDEHTTATNGAYELRESLEQEFKIGVHNFEYMTYIPPLFPDLIDVRLDYCDSKSNTLIRCADIVANQLYYMATKNDYSGLKNRNFDIIQLPNI